MAGIVKGLFGKSTDTVTTTVTEDADFADFAASTVTSVANAASSAASSLTQSLTFASGPTGVPAAKSIYGDEHPWYAIWERASPKDFFVEYFVISLIGLIVFFHIEGTRRNRAIANKWIKDHISILQKEFARVGFGKELTTTEEASAKVAAGQVVGEEDSLLLEDSPQEFIGYATGRLNVASMTTTIKLMRRPNPMIILGEYLFSSFFESMAPPADTVTISLLAADGTDAAKTGGQSSKYDGFVWAIVNKYNMSKYRNDRFDLSLTKTVDNAKLPPIFTVMTESAEITDLMLSKEIIEAVEQAGTSLQYLIITDQPVDKPTKSSELALVKKRIDLRLDLPSTGNTQSLISAFIRLPDFLVSSAHFRPEALRKVKATRDEERRKLEKAEEEEKAEERSVDRDEKKKKERDARLRNMTADEQKKFLEKERDKDARRMAKKQQVRR